MKTSKWMITFRMGRRIHFPSALIDDYDLKPGDCFRVRLDLNSQFVILTEAKGKKDEGHYVYLSRMSGGCTKNGNDLVGINDMILMSRISAPRKTMRKLVFVQMRRGVKVITFGYGRT